MATCKECIHEKLCVIKAFPDAFENTQWDKEPCDHFLSTADVAPKSEVTREIFEEIERFILTCIENDEKVFNSGEDEYYDGRFMGFKIIEEHLAELKKKYTEGK